MHVKPAALNDVNLAVHVCFDGVVLFASVIWSMWCHRMYAFMFFFLTKFCVCCLQLKSGYSSSGSSGGLPGGQITLNIQKVRIRRKCPFAVNFVWHMFYYTDFISQTWPVVLEKQFSNTTQISPTSNMFAFILVWESQCRVGAQPGVGQ